MAGLAGIVFPPQAEPPQYGLVASALGPAPGETPDDWARGFSWKPETCGGYSVISQCSDTVLDVPGPGPGTPHYEPWAVVVEDSCSTLSGADGMPDRLRRQVLARESHALARELWDGALTQADDLGNPYLTEADSAARPLTVLAGGAAVKLSVAQGLLEEALGDCLHGARGMIHAPRSVAAALAVQEKVGTSLFTRSGNVVVPDSGYPGTAPSGGTAAAESSTRWMAATGLVTVRRHPEIAILPGDDATGGVRISDNRRLYTAQRLVAATYDPCCRLFVLVDLTA